jgi:glycosyltransferase involved in cell wall biosynthesis
VTFDWVFFGSVAWSYTFQRSQQLASRLAQRGRVLYVDPIGLRPARLGDLRRLRPQGHLEGAPLPAGLRLLPRPRLALPFPASAWAARFNSRLLLAGIRDWMTQEGVTEPVVLLGIPSGPAWRAARGLHPKALGYDCHDDFVAFHGGRYGIPEAEAELIGCARPIFVSSEKLLEHVRKLGGTPVFLPNAVDAGFFKGAHPKPERLQHLPPPLIGYVGEIGSWFDVEAASRLARERPSWSIVLIGPVSHPEAPDLLSIPNVHHLGTVAHDKLPAYLAHFDCALVPFLLTPLTLAVSPVKVYEYLAAGLPVVSTRLPEVERMGDLVTIADGLMLSQGVTRALSLRHVDRVAERQRFASENTWDQRVKTMIQAFEEAVAP